jgi:hypothetical protein
MSSVVEVWRPVVGHEKNFEVSNTGRVRSLPHWFNHGVSGKHLFRDGKEIAQSTAKTGYKVVSLRDRKKHLVHCLVLEAFVGPRPTGGQKYEACHGNGIKEDNRLENLRWGTMSENHADRVRHGVSNRGERCGTARLTEQDVIEILRSSKPSVQIAKEKGVTVNAIQAVRDRRTWKHMQVDGVVPYKKQPRFGASHPLAKINENTAREVLAATGTISDIARRHAVSRYTVADIRSGKTWRHLRKETVA